MTIFRNIITSMQRRREIFDGFPNSIHSEAEQQKRMIRADGKYLYVKDISKDQRSGIVVGEEGEYQTSLSSCSCPDFQKRKQPCKHMYKLAFVTGRMDPDKYYHGDYKFKYYSRNIVPDNYRSDTAFADHMSVNKYSVQVINKYTRRIRKKTIYASSEEEVTHVLYEENGIPALGITREFYSLPTDHQIIYAVSQGIDIPEGCCKEDLTALLERYEEDEGRKGKMPDKTLVEFGKKQRIPFSLLSDETMTIKRIYQGLDGSKQVAFMLACMDKSFRHRWDFRYWGEWETAAEILMADASFKKSWQNNIELFTGFEYAPPSKNSKVYKMLKNALIRSERNV